MKEQKQVQEEISRMSSKAMLKVQEDIKALKQLLSLAASGIQRNTLNIDKLKIETAQVYHLMAILPYDFFVLFFPKIEIRCFVFLFCLFLIIKFDTYILVGNQIAHTL